MIVRSPGLCREYQPNLEGECDAQIQALAANVQSTFGHRPIIECTTTSLTYINLLSAVQQ